VSDADVAPGARETGASGLWRSLLALLLPILIVAMELGVYLLEPRVLSIGNLRNTLIQSSYLVLFASAQMVVILTRGFDLSLGASVSAISVASALAMTGLDAEGAADPAGQAGGEQRVAAEVEEALVGADPGHAENVGEPDQVGEDVGQFVADLARPYGIGHHVSRLGRGQPLEDLGQFARLAHQGHDQVLGTMELLPVPFGYELTKLLLKARDRHRSRIAGSHALRGAPALAAAGFTP